MKSVYEASSGIEAHMIDNLLRQNQIESEVFGEHLQGGLGDLQAIGIVRVMVSDQDYEAAREVVRQWDEPQPKIKDNHDTAGTQRWGYGSGLVGFILGVCVMLLFLRTSVERSGIDHNNDGRLDEHWTYLNNQLRSSEIDQNRDGEIDLIYRYKLDGAPDSMSSDSDFDGRFESQCRFEEGNIHSCRSDIDGDGFDEYRQTYTHGVLASISIFDTVSKRLKKRQFFDGLRLTRAEIDLDDDGHLETRQEYDEFEEVLK